MGHSGLLPFLALFILLWSFQETETFGSFGKKCPSFKIICEIEELDQCTNNKHCPEDEKCCPFNCGNKCLDLNKDVCDYPIVVGPCLAYIPRWAYDQKTMRCVKFIYGGCLGTPNSFQSEDICTIICMHKIIPEICRLPMERGQCRARIPLWYHNMEARKCKRFFYGGCGGNENLFITEENCKKVCKA